MTPRDQSIAEAATAMGALVYRRALERLIRANYVGLEIEALRASRDPIDRGAADLLQRIEEELADA